MAGARKLHLVTRDPTAWHKIQVNGKKKTPSNFTSTFPPLYNESKLVPSGIVWMVADGIGVIGLNQSI